MDRGASKESGAQALIRFLMSLEIDIGSDLWCDWDAIRWDNLPCGWLVMNP